MTIGTFGAPWVVRSSPPGTEGMPVKQLDIIVYPVDPKHMQQQFVQDPFRRRPRDRRRAARGRYGARILTSYSRRSPGALQGKPKSSKIGAESSKARPNFSQGNPWISLAKWSPFKVLRGPLTPFFLFRSPAGRLRRIRALSRPPNRSPRLVGAEVGRDVVDLLSKSLFRASSS